jgi:ribosome-associated protein
VGVDTLGERSETAIEGRDGTSTPDLTALENRERDSPAGGLVDLERVRTVARIAAQAAVDVKGEDVRVLDMHGLVTYTDFMVVCTGRNTRLTRRIAEEVAHRVKKQSGLMPRGTEGATGGEWILMDFLDFVVHVFTPEAREFYRLDVLWKQAPMEEIA